ncbi:c-type cytochrome [Azospirillum sp. sgz301742]
MLRLPTPVLMLAALAVVAFSGTASAEGDAAAGEKLFRQCKSCHAVEPDKNRVGPSLHGVLGRKAGSVGSFANYSEGLKSAGFVWDDSKLDAYLTNPKAVIADSKMSFAGLPAAEDRTNVIAYLKSLAK